MDGRHRLCRHIVDIDKVNSNIKNVNKHFGDFLASDDAQFCMRIDTEEVLPKIIESGKFKTQFETNTSGGALSTSLRELTPKSPDKTSSLKEPALK